MVIKLFWQVVFAWRYRMTWVFYDYNDELSFLDKGKDGIVQECGRFLFWYALHLMNSFFCFNLIFNMNNQSWQLSYVGCHKFWKLFVLFWTFNEWMRLIIERKKKIEHLMPPQLINWTDNNNIHKLVRGEKPIYIYV